MDYCALDSKLKAMKFYLFKRKDYLNLIKQENIEQVTEKLKKNKAYNKFICELDINNLHRSDIERKLFLSLRDDFKKIYGFIFDFRLKKYLDVFFLKNEIYILKLVLCMIYDKRELKYNISELDYIIGKKLKIDMNKLRSSENVERFIFNLKGSEFFDFMSKSYKETRNLFELEIKLDLYYYLRLDKILNKCLDGVEKKILKKINGIEVDLINIAWIYRIKKYYEIDREKIFSYLIPLEYRLKREEIVKFANAKDLLEFERMVKKSYYGDLFNKKDFNLEREIYDYMSDIYRKVYLSSGYSIFCVIYYFYLKRVEINNITAIIEGIRYKIGADKIMEYVFI